MTAHDPPTRSDGARTRRPTATTIEERPAPNGSTTAARVVARE
ncbi:hypothetical protein [Halorubrum sp. F4]|nr:hypothetical protein [Halorubrum sp. F4]